MEALLFALTIIVPYLRLASVEGLSVESMVESSSHINISTQPLADVEGIVGFCSQQGDEFTLEVTCEAPVCHMEDPDSAVAPRLLFNNVDISMATQVEIDGRKRFPSNCSKLWMMSIVLAAGESLVVQCSQQGGRLTSKDIVLQADVRWCHRYIPGEPDGLDTATVMPTPVIPVSSSTVEVGGGSTSTPGDSHSVVPISWIPSVVAVVLVILIVGVCTLILVSVCWCCKWNESRRTKSHAIPEGNHEGEDALLRQKYYSEMVITVNPCPPPKETPDDATRHNGMNGLI